MPEDNNMLLKKIADSTARTADALAKGRTKAKPVFSDDDEGGKKSSDPLSKDILSTIKSFRQFRKVADENIKSQKAAIDNLKESKKVRENLDKLSDAFKDGSERGEELSKVYDKNKAAFDSLNSTLKVHGIKSNELNKALSMAGGDIGKFNEKIEGIVGTLESNRSGLKNELDSLQDSFRTAAKSQVDGAKASMSGMATGLGTVLKSFSDIGLSTMATGFDIGSNMEEFSSDMGSLIKNSTLMGASPQEVQQFAARNRSLLTMAAGEAFTMAGDAAETARIYGDMVNKTFGVSGQAQLDMISKGMETLSNLGQAVTPETFNAFNNSINRMAKTSNMTADEIYTQVNELSKLDGVRGLALSLGQSANTATFLTESFLNLQKQTGLNADEFMEYRKKLAQERNRTGSDRVVQGAMTAQLAQSVGGFSSENIGLLERGMAYPESLKDDQLALFEELRVQLGKSLAEQRQEALENGLTGRVQELDILSKRSNVEERVSLLSREASGETKAIQDAQDVRVKVADDGAGPLLETNAALREFINGFTNSPFGKAAAFSGLMTGAVTAGVVAGNVLTGGGGGLAKRLLGGGLLRGGLIAGVAVGAFKGIHAVQGAMTTQLAKSLETNAALRKFINGFTNSPFGKAAAFSGLMTGAVRAGVTGGVAVGAFKGINKVLQMDENAPAMEKFLTGFGEIGDTLTFGYASKAGEWISDGLSKDINQVTGNQDTEKVKYKTTDVSLAQQLANKRSNESQMQQKLLADANKLEEKLKQESVDNNETNMELAKEQNSTLVAEIQHGNNIASKQVGLIDKIVSDQPRISVLTGGSMPTRSSKAVRLSSKNRRA